MSQSRDEMYMRSLKDTHAELQTIKGSGNGLVIAGIVGAVVLYLGAGLAAFAYFGGDALASLNPVWFVAAVVLLAGPAIAMVMAGFLARQSLQTARSNALVLRASQMLLMPADLAAGRIDTLATRVQEETGRMDELVEGTHASLSELKISLTEERESLSKFIAENRTHIADMVTKLSDERQALAELTSSVEAQTAAISDAIPRQARTMAEAARLAQQEVAKADLAVDERLKALDDAGRHLGERLSVLGDLSIDAEQRSKRLGEALAAISKQLDASAQTVDTAIRASEMAVSAATETGDSLSAAISGALDGTREATEFIRKQSREAVAEAMEAMRELRQAGLDAESSTKLAGEAARAEAEQTEERIAELTQRLYEAATRATSVADAGLESARKRIERASALLSGLDDTSLFLTPSPAPSPVPEQTVSRPQPPEPEPEPPATAAVPTAPTEPPKSEPLGLRPRQSEETPKPATDKTGSEDQSAPPPPEYKPAPKASSERETEKPAGHAAADLDTSLFDLAFERASQKEMGVTWRDLLSGMEAEPEERDEAARHIISEIQDVGIELSELLNPKETRKIASASRRNEKYQRRLVREYSGSAVQTLIYRLEDDHRFRPAVMRFLESEQTDAMRSLTEAEKSRTGASPRLAAYLVLDVAYSALEDDNQ
ncbi:MAG: hypothetical protein CMK07_01310 [Ponticaulis sp.]|nr:hypothetical protein [Ponticaulis sp.]